MLLPAPVIHNPWLPATTPHACCATNSMQTAQLSAPFSSPPCLLCSALLCGILVPRALNRLRACTESCLPACTDIADGFQTVPPGVGRTAAASDIRAVVRWHIRRQKRLQPAPDTTHVCMRVCAGWRYKEEHRRKHTREKSIGRLLQQLPAALPLPLPVDSARCCPKPGQLSSHQIGGKKRERETLKQKQPRQFKQLTAAETTTLATKGVLSDCPQELHVGRTRRAAQGVQKGENSDHTRGNKIETTETALCPHPAQARHLAWLSHAQGWMHPLCVARPTHGRVLGHKPVICRHTSVLHSCRLHPAKRGRQPHTHTRVRQNPAAQPLPQQPLSQTPEVAARGNPGCVSTHVSTCQHMK